MILNSGLWKDNMYASLVGSLIFAQVCRRPYITSTTSVLGKYQLILGLQLRGSEESFNILQWIKDFTFTYARMIHLKWCVMQCEFRMYRWH